MSRFCSVVLVLASVWFGKGGTAATHATAELAVEPANLVFEVLAGDPTPTRRTFELRSLVSSEQSWFTSVNWPQLIRVDPASGSLAGLEKATLTVTALASNAWPSKVGYAGDISIMPWGRPEVSFLVQVRPSARLVPDSGALSFGIAPDGVVFERQLALHNTGFNTPGAGLSLFDGFFKLVKTPASNPAWDDRWSVGLDTSGQNLILTNNQSRAFPVRARYDWDLPPGRYQATLTTDAAWQLAEPLALPIELVVGEDSIVIDRLTSLPMTIPGEPSKLSFEARVFAQVQSVERGEVRLTVYEPKGVSAIGYSEWVGIDRLSGVSNLFLRTPPVSVSSYPNVVVKAAMTVYHSGYDWKYSAPFIVTLGADDLVVDHLETVQGVRDGTGQLPLVALKSTVVRVFPRVQGDNPAPMLNVSGELSGYRGGVLLPGPALRPLNPGLTAYPSPQPSALNHSLNFVLPPEWTIPGQLELRAQVSEPGHKDRNPDNNATNRTLTFSSRVLNIAYVLCTNDGGALPPVSLDRAQTAGELLRQLYPAWVDYQPWDHAIRSIPRCPPEVRSADNWYGIQLRSWLDQIRPSARPDLLVGFVPASANMGRAYLPLTETPDGKYIDAQAVAALELSANSPSYDQFLLCHEVGHLFCLVHPDFVPAAILNYLRPPKYTEDLIVNLNGVLSRRKPELDNYEIMNSGINNDRRVWISQFSWTNLFRFFREPSLRLNTLSVPRSMAVSGVPAPNALLNVRGWVDLSGTGGLLCAYPAFSADGTEDDGSCSIRFDDSAGQAVAETRFSVSRLDAYGRVVDGGPFAITVAEPPAFASLALVKDGRVLARQELSAHAPVVNFTTPGGGEPLAPVGPIRWSASDKDGAPLRYLISYSPDNRMTWIPLAFDLELSAFDLDTTLLPGGDRFWLRVVASDGLNHGTTEAGPFVIADKPPTVRIFLPQTNQVAASGIPLLLSGEAHDLEDHSIVRTNLVWASDADGLLGSGLSLSVDSLSSGQHWITLTATDSKGHTGTARVPIRVVEGGHINCESGAIDLGAVLIGQSREFGLELRNQGAGLLRVDAVSTNNPQYEVLSSAFPMPIPPGSAEVLPLRFTPATHGLQTATLTLRSNDPEQDPYFVRLTCFGATALENWRQERFGAYDAAQERDDGADPDGDGIVNLVEFAFGLNPLEHDLGPLLCPVETQDFLTLSFEQPTGIAGIIYRADYASEVSTEAWRSVPDSGTNGVHTFRVPIGTAGAGFLRLTISKP